MHYVQNIYMANIEDANDGDNPLFKGNHVYVIYNLLITIACKSIQMY